MKKTLSTTLAALTFAFTAASCATTDDGAAEAAFDATEPDAPTAQVDTAAEAAAADADAPRVLASGDLEVPVPRDWIGYRLGLQPPALRAIGRVDRFVPVERDDPPSPFPTSGEDKSEGPEQLRAISADGTIYEVLTAEQDFAVLHREMNRLGLTGASTREGGEVSGSGWSDGTDSRTRRVDAANDYPRDTIGRLSSGCTGTLFEGRLVITAFHCFFDGKGNWVGGLSFAAGQDGSAKPYGDVAHTWKYWSQGFIDNDCHKWKISGYSTTCEKYDWAVVVLASTPVSAGGATPGWMGYHYNSNNDSVAGWSQYHRGYPGCGAVNAPAGCVDNSMYAQAAKCPIGDFFNSVDGWDRNFMHGCDSSGGHSGGPMYTWTPGNNGPYVVGINIAESCKASDCKGDSTPNIAVRIDQWLGQKMSYYRSIY